MRSRITMIVCWIIQSVILARGLAWAREVCYDDFGCFSDDPPFNNVPGYIPRPPEEVEPSFLLYTSNSPNESVVIHYSTRAEGISLLDFDPTLRTKIVLPGYLNKPSFSFYQDVKNDYVTMGANVFLVDWTEAAGEPRYSQAVANCRIIAPMVARFIYSLVEIRGVDLKGVHVIGLSLSGPLAGYIGRYIPGLGRITGLDPTSYGFKGSPEVRLKPTDALFVDVIHTDGETIPALGLGMNDIMGDADFFVMGGHHQPGCHRKSFIPFDFKKFLCSHSRSSFLFRSSIIRCQFPTTKCSSVAEARKHKCTEETEQLMGEDSRSDLHGVFYVETLAEYPFCEEEQRRLMG